MQEPQKELLEKEGQQLPAAEEAGVARAEEELKYDQESLGDEAKADQAQQSQPPIRDGQTGSNRYR